MLLPSRPARIAYTIHADANDNVAGDEDKVDLRAYLRASAGATEDRELAAVMRPHRLEVRLLACARALTHRSSVATRALCMHLRKHTFNAVVTHGEYTERSELAVCARPQESVNRRTIRCDWLRRLRVLRRRAPSVFSVGVLRRHDPSAQHSRWKALTSAEHVCVTQCSARGVV
jgi:hypothetical protein